MGKAPMSGFADQGWAHRGDESASVVASHHTAGAEEAKLAPAVARDRPGGLELAGG